MEALRETPEGQRRIGEAITRIFDHVSKEIDKSATTPEAGVDAEGGQGSQGEIPVSEHPRGQPHEHPREHPQPQPPSTAMEDGEQNETAETAGPDEPATMETDAMGAGAAPTTTPAIPTEAKATGSATGSTTVANTAPTGAIVVSGMHAIRGTKRSAGPDHEDSTAGKFAMVESTEDDPLAPPEGTLPSIRAALYGKSSTTDGKQSLGAIEVELDIDVIKEIAMTRETGIPIRENIANMRRVAEVIEKYEHEVPENLVKEVLNVTMGGRENSADSRQAKKSQFMGIRMPYQGRSTPDAYNRSDGDLPPATDDDRQDQLYPEDKQIGPESKPGSHQRSRGRSRGLNQWEREDYACRQHVTTGQRGPDWRDVVRRQVQDTDTGELIEDIRVHEGSNEEDYQYEIGMLGDGAGQAKNIRSIFSFRGGYKPDITEVYSPPRIGPEVEKIGLMKGDSFDLTVKRTDGHPWDFEKRLHRMEAMRKIIKDEPYFVIGSPPCTIWSILQNGNRGRYSEEEWAAKLRAGKVHIDFCLAIYEVQRRAGRYYLHEHPRTATSLGLNEGAKIER